MRIWLTGGTGYIGRAVLHQLREHDHEVVALVRSEEAAATVAAAGATPVLGDLTDVGWTAAQLAEVDGAIHTASPGGGPAGQAFDTAMAHAAIEAFGGTTRPYVHTGGIQCRVVEISRRCAPPRHAPRGVLLGRDRTPLSLPRRPCDART